MWGPPSPDGAPGLWDVPMRRYRCTSCGAVRTAVRPGLGARLRYSLCAIALALTAWAIWGWSAANVRAEVSPFRIVGASEAERWRSLRRWAVRSESLFRLPKSPTSAGPRLRAARAVALVRARGPTDAAERMRVFVGARAG
jgi:hypothetical protein